jgi:signal transduction histidine kinase
MLMKNMPEDSEFQSSLKVIYTSGLRVKKLVKQILTFSRQDTGKVKLIKMQPIIREAFTFLRSTIPATIKIKQDIHGDCGGINADPIHIHQIVMHLATNAYHSMEDTGGELKICLKEIQLSRRESIDPKMGPGLYACLTIADTGPGFDRDVKEKIFDPFFTTKEVNKGTGLGLSVVHGIVKSIGGTIHVSSELGKGTEFHVYLPVGKCTSLL